LRRADRDRTPAQARRTNHIAPIVKMLTRLVTSTRRWVTRSRTNGIEHGRAGARHRRRRGRIIYERVISARRIDPGLRLQPYAGSQGR
jgi:hypothetical protein